MVNNATELGIVMGAAVFLVINNECFRAQAPSLAAMEAELRQLQQQRVDLEHKRRQWEFEMGASITTIPATTVAARSRSILQEHS
jgi:uncharacterized protein YlxW (UPF0749 family)